MDEWSNIQVLEVSHFFIIFAKNHKDMTEREQLFREKAEKYIRQLLTAHGITQEPHFDGYVETTCGDLIN